MEDKLDNIKLSQDAFHSSNKEEHAEIKRLLENKADKWVEKAVTWFIALTMTLVLTALIYLVVKR